MKVFDWMRHRLPWRQMNKYTPVREQQGSRVLTEAESQVFEERKQVAGFTRKLDS